MIADDLFAGAGGWDLAAAELGIHARGVENMKEARATRDAAGLTTIHDDVWTFQPDGKADGLIASPPCPPWSQAGKKNGVGAFADIERCARSGAYLDLKRLKGLGTYLGDERVALVLTPLHFAMTGSYRWLAWEQVKGVLPIWNLCAEVLEENGWNVWTGKVTSERYGVAQTRERALFLASLDGPVGEPEPTHSRYYARDPSRLDLGVLPWVSMADGLEAGGCDRWGLTERPSPTITGGGVETGGAEPIAKIVERWTTRPDWCYRRPSTTIVGSFRPEIVAAPGYRVKVSRQNAPDSVRVTVAEAGVLQSFPVNHPWQGATGKQYLQAGNAFPPGAALHALAAAAGINAKERAT
jgi:DNA (cytosine-5)-methyltransferase 1